MAYPQDNLLTAPILNPIEIVKSDSEKVSATTFAFLLFFVFYYFIF